MAKLRQVWEEIQSDIFTYKFPPVQAEGDEVQVDIEVLRSDDSFGPTRYKRLSQKIPVSGGWKVSGGLALNYGVLVNTPYSYTLIDNVIVADELDAFTPTIASLAHVYKQTTRNVNLGGSFGIGFPLFGGTSGQTISFFLGPTVILGKQQKFLISGGLMGAKVNRLSSGFMPGDVIESTINGIPTNDRYELGDFIGISYDLIK